MKPHTDRIANVDQEWQRLVRVLPIDDSACWLDLPVYWKAKIGGRWRTVRLDRWLYSLRVKRWLPARFRLRATCGKGFCHNPWHQEVEHVMSSQVRKFKLTDDQVRAIRSDSRPAPVVAAEHGISIDHVRGIRHRRRKQFVPDVAPIPGDHDAAQAKAAE